MSGSRWPTANEPNTGSFGLRSLNGSPRSAKWVEPAPPSLYIVMLWVPPMPLCSLTTHLVANVVFFNIFKKNEWGSCDAKRERLHCHCSLRTIVSSSSDGRLHSWRFTNILWEWRLIIRASDDTCTLQTDVRSVGGQSDDEVIWGKATRGTF